MFRMGIVFFFFEFFFAALPSCKPFLVAVNGSTVGRRVGTFLWTVDDDDGGHHR